jgi:UDP-N-acetyl-D-glucosamine dehydrogenase
MAVGEIVRSIVQWPWIFPPEAASCPLMSESGGLPGTPGRSETATTSLPTVAAAQNTPSPATPASATRLPAEPAVQTSAVTPAGEVALAHTDHAVVAVVGLGYVGLPTAIAIRSAGCRIVGIDVSQARLRAIRTGEAELLDTERADLARYLSGDGFVLTDRIEALDAADLVLICVPTPIDELQLPDLAILQHVCASVVEHARAGQTIVLTSTTYVGCTRELLVEPLAERGLRIGEDVCVAFAPERIDPGVAGHEQRSTPRVLGGVTETCFRRAAELLRHTCAHLHRVSSPEAAEMVKLYENTFRAVNIALAFEIAEACRVHGLDPIEITDGAATKPYGFLPHYPSAGVGGHCIAVDPHYLLAPLRDRGRPAATAEQALRTLTGRPRHIAWRAHEVLVELGLRLADARILLVGVSYKPGVADTRESPAVEILRRLREDGVHVDYHDPLVPELALGPSHGHIDEGFEPGEEPLLGVDPDPRRDGSGFGPEDYDLAILATVHPGHDYGWLARCPAVLDCTYRTPGGRVRFLP